MIKGLTDQMVLPRGGKIRLGVMKENASGKMYPSETKHFVVPEEVAAIYGDEPTELDVMFPIDDAEAVFSQWYKWYGSDQGLKCKGDGETAMRRYDLVDDKDAIDEPPPNETDMVEVQCSCFRLQNKSDTKNCCGPRANLMVILPRINRFECYQLDISSIYSIKNINSMMRILSAQLGRISMIPLKLSRVPQEMTHDGKKRTHYLLHLSCHLTDQQLSTVQLHPNAPAAMIEAPHEDGPDPISPTPVVQEDAKVDVAEQINTNATAIQKERIVELLDTKDLSFDLAAGITREMGRPDYPNARAADAIVFLEELPKRLPDVPPMSELYPEDAGVLAAEVLVGQPN